MFDTTEDGLRLLRHLRARRHHVVVFHLLHADELSFPFSRLTLFESMEDDREVLVDPGGIRRAYMAEMGRFLADPRRRCEEAEIEYQQVSTAEPLDQVLLHFLSSARGRGRA